MQNVIDKNRPLISVITPAYNAERFISVTIDSVLAQTYEHWEMVIVDDCSTDRTVAIVKDYQKRDNRIKLVQLKENSGPAVTRNTAISHARGRFLAFLDSDDEWLSNKLEIQLNFMLNKNIGFSFTKYKFMSEEGIETGKISDVPDVVAYNHLLKNNVIGCLTVMLDRDIVGEVEMVNIRSRQDYVLWLHLTKKGCLAYGLKEVLAKYREVENSLSSNKIKMAKQNWYVYREIEGLNLVKSAWYFINYAYFKLKKYKV